MLRLRRRKRTLSVYRDPQGCDIVATLSVAMISQSCELRYHSLAQQNFCDIAQYCKKGVIFGRFLQYWQYRKNLYCANVKISQQNLLRYCWRGVPSGVRRQYRNKFCCDIFQYRNEILRFFDFLLRYYPILQQNFGIFRNFRNFSEMFCNIG